VVAVWISEGASNDGIARIVAAKPASCESKQSTEKIHIQNFILNWQHYATYDGSLTTPGCGENVTFLILLEGITATADQIAKLKLLSTGNARPVQDLNGRTIQWRQMP
jgi:carbonic anhydrase